MRHGHRIVAKPVPERPIGPAGFLRVTSAKRAAGVVADIAATNRPAGNAGWDRQPGKKVRSSETSVQT
jgi:hypothetical protein